MECQIFARVICTTSVSIHRQLRETSLQKEHKNNVITHTQCVENRNQNINKNNAKLRNTTTAISIGAIEKLD